MFGLLGKEASWISVGDAGVETFPNPPISHIYIYQY